MAPVQTGNLPLSLVRRADGSADFESTPEAIVVPVVIISLLLIGAAVAAVHTWWRRRASNDHISDKAIPPKPSRKLLPNWLSNWIDTPKLRSSRSSTSLESTQAHKFDSGNLTSENRDSHTIALRPISVYLPTYPLTAHETYDRYPSLVAAGSQDLRPKVVGAPLR